MAKEFFKDLPNTTTPLTATRLNGLLDGEEALGNIVVDSIRSKNINSKTLVQGLYQVSDGTPNYGYANYVTLDGFLPISYGETITISNKNNISGTYFVLEYDSNMQYLNQNQNAVGTSATFTIVNSNTKYIAIDLGSTGATPQTIGNFQVELGESATNYAPYQELGTDNFKNEEIVVGKIRSKNILDKNATIYRSTGISSTTILNDGIRVYCSNTSSGVYSAYFIGKYSDFYGKTITAKSVIKPNSSRKVGLMIWAETGGSITSLSEVEGTGTNVTLTNTYTFNNSTYNNYNVLIGLYAKLGSSGSVTTSDYADFTELQVEEGSTPTTYYPYQDLTGMTNIVDLLAYTDITQGTEYTLNDNIYNYKYLIVQLSTSSNEANSNKQYIPTQLIKKFDNTCRVAISLFQSTSVYVFGDFYFSASNKIYCNTYTHGSWNGRLKVWGIK